MSRDADEQTADTRETAVQRGPNPPAPTDGSDDLGSRSVWHARWALVRRELRSLRSEKTILLAIAIQLFIAAFSSFLVVGLVSMYDPGSVEGYQTEVAITGDDTDALLAAANEQEGLRAITYDDPADAYDDFESGSSHVTAVLDANRDDDGRLVVRTTLPEEGLETTLLVVQLRETLEAVEHDERVANDDRLEATPLEIPPAVEASPYVGFTYTILVPLLLFLPAFISGSIVVDSVIEERERGTLELLRVAPLSFVDVVDAKLVATTALAPIQAVAWLALLAANGTEIGNSAALLVLVTALSLLVVAIGSGVALYAPDRRQAQLLYSIAIVAALVVATLLPEHPANTVAKFAIDNPTETTWLLLALYVLCGALALAVLRRGITALEPESL
ncbi:ABC transporter permease [Salinadaptatus halalkaliphilus]|uniref:ABC transporter permease n=1 Tax=Salinadaptatus halalkaliphilus TaxID=2419781 RepID=A0A4S3TLE8_9EURY|nr:ABC transporter permease [Salinadaptatus halalkaliphilus]THE63795.1 ABC transporter permease [Salinadaptatus halalkaliphilus]